MGEREGRNHVHQEESLTGSSPTESMSNCDRFLKDGKMWESKCRQSTLSVLPPLNGV